MPQPGMIRGLEFVAFVMDVHQCIIWFNLSLARSLKAPLRGMFLPSLPGPGRQLLIQSFRTPDRIW